MTDNVHAYKLKYTLADNETQTKFSFTAEATTLDVAVKLLVESMPPKYNPANIDIVDVICDGISLGLDGKCTAEESLAKYYS